MKRLLTTALLLLPLGASGQIYQTTDENGTVMYSDVPPDDTSNAREITLQPANTVAPPTMTPARNKNDTAQNQADEAVEWTVTIDAPETETTIAMGPGNFSVSASAAPTPMSGEKLLLKVDGTPWGSAQSSGNWNLTNVFRGSHDLTVELQSPEGDTLATSEPVRVYVLRPSVNFKNRQ